MTCYFVSRHPGAVQWAALQDLQVDAWVPHLDPAEVQPGDTVIGSLPVNLAAQVCQRGAAYWHLSLALTADLRGRELTSDELQRLGAMVCRYHIESVTTKESVPS